MAALAEALRGLRSTAGRLVAVLSILDDKDAAGMLRELLPLLRRGRLHRQRQPAGAVAGDARSRWRGQLGGAAGAHGPIRARRSSGARRGRARTASPLATGSIYLIADLLRPAGAAAGTCEHDAVKRRRAAPRDARADGPPS